jgi:hypothetical protein
VATISDSRTWSWGPITVPYAVAPLPRTEIVPVEMTTGLVLTIPEVGDQCWDNYPLCSFSMGSDIGLRGTSIQDGFERR